VPDFVDLLYPRLRLKIAKADISLYDADRILDLLELLSARTEPDVLHLDISDRHHGVSSYVNRMIGAVRPNVADVEAVDFRPS
jgi:hypothetical protein